jgi:hypothetical protein
MNLDPIDALLCDCLGRASNLELIECLNSLSMGDWENLWQRAMNQFVPTLLYHRIKSLHPSQPFPASILAKMRSHTLAGAQLSIRQRHGTSVVLRALQDHGLPVIVLKGAYLREVVYQSIALRIMGDVDLMVQKADLARVVETLQALGYSTRFVPLEERVTWNNELSPFQKTGSPTLDVHWDLERPDTLFQPDLDGLWQRAREATVAEVKVKALAPEDLLLHLCLHASSHHRFNMGLRNLCDIREVLLYFANRLDWQQVLERARQWNAIRPLYLNLFLARELLGAEMPAEILDGIRPADFGPEIENDVLVRLFEGILPSSAVPAPLARAWGSQANKDTLPVLFKYAFPTRNTLAGIYSLAPSSLRIYLYYPVRWWYLARRWGGLIWGLIIRDKNALASLTEVKDDLAEEDALQAWLARR